MIFFLSLSFRYVSVFSVNKAAKFLTYAKYGNKHVRFIPTQRIKQHELLLVSPLFVYFRKG